MSKHKTFPREGSKKLKETIQDQKAYIRELEARVEFLERQLNISSDEVEPEPQTELTPEEKLEQWRKDFVKRIKEGK